MVKHGLLENAPFSSMFSCNELLRAGIVQLARELFTER